MKENENGHYTESVIYLMEQTVVYFRIKGAQFLSQMDIGVTIDQFAVLDAIYTNNDICQRDLSKIVLKDRSNTGRILNILEDNGFIQRVAETKGNRLVKMVYLTDKGKRLIEENHPKLRASFGKVVEEAVSVEELAALRKTLEKLKTSVSKTTSIQI